MSSAPIEHGSSLEVRWKTRMGNLNTVANIVVVVVVVVVFGVI